MGRRIVVTVIVGMRVRMTTSRRMLLVVTMIVAVPCPVGMHVLVFVIICVVSLVAIDLHFAVAATACRTHRFAP
jgi:hypothetical protein